jgi:hypothetical protein
VEANRPANGVAALNALLGELHDEAAKGGMPATAMVVADAKAELDALLAAMRTAKHLLRRIDEAESLYGAYLCDTDCSLRDWLNQRDQFMKDNP